MVRYKNRIPFAAESLPINENRFHNIDKKPGILSNYRKGIKVNFTQLQGRTLNDSYMATKSHQPDYEKKDEAKDYLMKKLNRGSIDMKKSSPLKDRGMRNSITTMSEAIPSLFT